MTSDADGIDNSLPRLCWCAIYTRQSREPTDEYSSCEAQFDACFAFIRSRISDGWRCSRRFSDVAESSETLERPGFQRLLHAVRDGKVDRIVVHRLDRISRRILDCTEFLQELRTRQIALTITTQPELGISAGDTLILNVMASFAEFEQTMTRERLADARAAHKRRGRRVAGVVPYGYETDRITKQLKIVRQEANHIRKMFLWAAEGKTPSAIATIANKRRWRTKQRTSRNGRVIGGGKWTSRQILATFSNPVYAGLIIDGDSTRPGIHEAIVDQALFEQVRQLVESRQTRKPGRRNSTVLWPLRGLLCCGHCQRPMSPNTSRHGNVRYRYYRCRSTADGKPPCENVNVPAYEIERFVEDMLSTLECETSVTDEPGTSELLYQFVDHWKELDSFARFKLLPEVLERVVFNDLKETVEVIVDSLALQRLIEESAPSARSERKV